MGEVRAYSTFEEILNSATHGVGMIFSVVAITLLVTLASVNANAWAIVSCSIFGASMFALYSVSTFYHAIPFEGAKKVLKKCDHIAIYYLIAGSYTPFMLVSMRSATGWSIFGTIWGLAIIGTVLKIFTSGAGTKIWSIGLYLAMGWMVIFVSKMLYSVLPTSGFVFLVLGGVFYTGGVIFYVQKKRPYSHAIWHIFVLLGTVMHFFSVLFSCVL